MNALLQKVNDNQYLMMRYLLKDRFCSSKLVFKVLILHDFLMMFSTFLQCTMFYSSLQPIHDAVFTYDDEKLPEQPEKTMNVVICRIAL